uniref:Uncharacterized protein n=1 Tax=Nelumbo nucifera TaxID=4432 RepID=A0A822Y6M9_NELNU|nr:TPA_asm: hypothetical protein HUJ06_029370 [Nelumbo nucifera]
MSTLKVESERDEEQKNEKMPPPPVKVHPDKVGSGESVGPSPPSPKRTSELTEACCADKSPCTSQSD